MNILIGGDFAPKQKITSMILKNDYSFFSSLRQLTQKADYSIINLECPFMEKGDSPIIKWGPNLGCPTATAKALSFAGISAVTLANNHIMDYGANAMFRTMKECSKFGIETIGAGRNSTEAAKPLIISIKGKTVGIINCCEHEFSIAEKVAPGANPLDPIAQYYQIRELKSKVSVLIVIVHGGHEHYQLPSTRMQKTYRFFIDAGADAVINHHQHCYSGIERYNRKPIFYGLGNLCFEGTGNANKIWHEGFMVNLRLDNNDILYDIIPYTQLRQDMTIEFSTPNNFDEKLSELNAIIGNSEALHTAENNYYSSSAKHIESIFDIYTNRILYKLRQLHFLPSFITKKRKLRMQNHIMCESHHDKVKHYFTHH